ncbi:MAG TPA: HIT domain-containing protein [Caulobacteraceae bacterium]|nr:HIT domain-containing protein [Caulobacteraceae bacterium]
MFVLDPAFEATTAPIIGLGLCEARLQLDARWPWVVLVPRRAGVAEIEELSRQDRAQLMEEILLAGAAVRAIGASAGRAVAKLNVGALGNITRQLHVHVVGRREDDAAWPGPVWGVGEAKAPTPAELDRAMAAALAVLQASPASP